MTSMNLITRTVRSKRFHNLAAALAFAAAVVGLTPTPGWAQGPGGTSILPLDPNATRLVLIPTARTLPRGVSSLTLLDVFFPIVQVGITDRVSLGAGTLLLPVNRLPLFVLPKVQVYQGANTSASAGVLHLAAGTEGSLGLAFGVVTHGTEDAAFTVGGGLSYARFDDEAGSLPMALLGFERRASPRIKIVADAMILGYVNVANIGVRVIRERFAADFSLMVLTADSEVIAGPTVSFGWRF